MKAPALLLTAFIALAAALPGQARPKNVTDPDIPRSLPTDGGAVSVQWTDPAQFSEIKFSGNRWESEQGTWVVDLARYLRDEAGQRLARGQTMDVTITDIDRAGRYEPVVRAAMQDIRIVKDIYPPRMTLRFVVKGRAQAGRPWFPDGHQRQQQRQPALREAPDRRLAAPRVQGQCRADGHALTATP